MTGSQPYQANPTARSPHVTERRETWRCYLCGRQFAHGRWLAGHLMDVHGEAR